MLQKSPALLLQPRVMLQKPPALLPRRLIEQPRLLLSSLQLRLLRLVRQGLLRKWRCAEGCGCGFLRAGRIDLLLVGQ